MSDIDDSGVPAALSERDAAFLAEMGITPLWRMRAAPAAAPVVAGGDAAVADAGADAGAPAADTLSHLDWRGLNEAIAACTRCACKDGQKPVLGEGARAAVWMVTAGVSSTFDEAARQPVAGAAGKLLDNMLAAVQLSRDENVYVTNLVKCRPTSANGGDRAPTGEEVAACRPFVERELALCGASVVLTLGQVAANALLDQPLQAPLAAARGAVHQFGNAALVATLHPAELLQRGADKALAWDDLCLARVAGAGEAGHGGHGHGR